MEVRTSSTALMVVSIDSSRFGSPYLYKILGYLLERHDRVLTLIADDLMIYNRLRLGLTPVHMQHLAIQYGAESRTHLRRVVRREPTWNDRVRVTCWRSFCDSRFVAMMRRAFLLFTLDERFRQAVLDRAE